MNNTTKKLQEWAVNKIKTEYPDDVALLIAVDGISVNGDGHGECFDYYVPATARGYEMGMTFMVNGIGYDLYPRDWERCEQTANFDNPAAFLLMNANIVYSRSAEDTLRFEQLQQKQQDNLRNKDFVYRKALDKLDTAMNFYRTLMFEEQFQKAFSGLGFIEFYLATAVLLLNERMYAWSSDYYSEFKTLAALPRNFVEYHNTILTAHSIDECRSLAHLLISTTRKFISEYKPNSGSNIKKPDAALASWYEELSLKWRRIYYHCGINEFDLILSDAVDLQSELNIVGSEYGLNDVDLLSSFNVNNISAFSARAKEIEKYIVDYLTRHNVKINSYATIEEFLAEN